LVLIASPIDADFLAHLQATKNIRKVIIINLGPHGDPVFAGMSESRLLWAKSMLEKQNDDSGATRGIGQFYYRPASEEERARRRQLAKFLFEQGLR
jgi:hypothetical protein